MPQEPENLSKLDDPRTRICSGTCKQEKTLDQFYLRRDRPNGRQSRCIECSNGERWKGGRFKDEEHKQTVYAANKVSYERHKSKYQKRARKRNARFKQKALEAHGSTACERCGYDRHSSALDFHHRDRAQKLFNVSVALQAPDKYSWYEILHEIAKCDVICSNCHNIEHTIDTDDHERL